jgi:hypothetical protein
MLVYNYKMINEVNKIILAPVIRIIKSIQGSILWSWQQT